MQNILIYGTGGQAKVTYDAVLSQGLYRAAGFVVDDYEVEPGQTFLGLPIYHFKQLDQVSANGTQHFIVGIGDNLTRRAKHEAMVARGFQPVTIIHSSANIGRFGQIGPGTLICAGTTIDPDVQIGEGTIVNGGAMIGHESRLGSFMHHGPGAIVAGDCRVGDHVLIGIGAMILSRLTVGNNAFVAAGAVVTKHVPEGMMAIGMPARFRARKV
jgi:sugar O-acyltransferase (sialic acid O-acetyltransferase NeuD family)